MPVPAGPDPDSGVGHVHLRERAVAERLSPALGVRDSLQSDPPPGSLTAKVNPSCHWWSFFGVASPLSVGISVLTPTCCLFWPTCSHSAFGFAGIIESCDGRSCQLECASGLEADLSVPQAEITCKGDRWSWPVSFLSFFSNQYFACWVMEMVLAKMQRARRMLRSRLKE